MTFEQKQTRHRRFFEPLQKGEGGYLAVTSPVDDSGTLPVALPPPKNAEERWLSTEYRLLCAEAAAANTFWGQDAIHNEFVNFGPGVQAALLGAPYKLESSSIWFDTDPPLKDWGDLPAFVTDEGHALYLAIEEHTRALCAASRGRYTVSLTDIGGQLDVLFSLRGEELLMDLIDYPEEVLALQSRLDDEFMKYCKTLCGIIRPTGCGFTSWMPLLRDEPYYPIQCDFSVMISPAMFEEFAMPSLDRISREVGCGVYHLDGPEQIQHLDMILSLSHVHAIQWVPLPMQLEGSDRVMQYFNDAVSLDLYRRCLAAGKKLILYGVNPGQIASIFSNVGTDGIYIITNCPSRKDADALIGQARNEWIR